MKKLVFGIALTAAMGLGIMSSVSTEEVHAIQSLEEEISIGEGIPCWSSGTSPLISFRRYVECASCTSVKGKPTGGAGNCGG